MKGKDKIIQELRNYRNHQIIELFLLRSVIKKIRID
jgi:hypothetical protein